MNRVRDDHPWPETVRADSRVDTRADTREDLLAPATQIVADRDAYLGQGRHTIGRRISDDQVELFVTGDAATALQREFEQHSSEFIAVHDVGASASLRLLSSLAGTANAPVQRLTIRRQGYGLALAVLQFVEVPLADGAAVRIFSTDASADIPTRQALSRTLLAHSRLGVLITGDVPVHSVAAALQPLREAIARGPWSNREILLVPLGSSAALAAQAVQLSGGSAVAAQVTPQAIRPKHIWTFIAGAWNRLNAMAGTTTRTVETDIERAVRRDDSAAPAAPAATAAAVASGAESSLAASARSMPSPGGTQWQAYVERCAAIKGVISCCVFDIHAAKPLAAIGQVPSDERSASQGAGLLNAATEASRAMGLGSSLPELSMSTTAHHLILRPVAGHPGMVVNLVLLASVGNVTLARMQLERVEPPA